MAIVRSFLLSLLLAGCTGPASRSTNNAPAKNPATAVVPAPPHDTTVTAPHDSATVVSPAPARDTAHKPATPARSHAGKPYVRMLPWTNGERDIQLYNAAGQLTFTMTETHRSYNTRVTLSYRPDSSVAQAEIHDAPDGGRYWYETTITFSSDNEPLTKNEKRMPEESIEDLSGKDFTWDKTKKDWVKQ